MQPVISALKHLNNCVIYIGFVLNERMQWKLLSSPTAFSCTTKTESNSNEIIISFVCRIVLFRCTAVSTNSAMERWLHSIHPRRLYLQQIRTFLCFDCDCTRPCHSLSNNKSEQWATYTHVRLYGAKTTSLRVPFMFVFDFIMISKQTRAWMERERGWREQIEEKIWTLFLSFVNCMKYQTAIILLLFVQAQMHGSIWWWLLWYFTIDVFVSQIAVLFVEMSARMMLRIESSSYID